MTNEFEDGPSDDIAQSLAEIATASEAIFENAERLYFEAEMLRAAGAIERSLFLHQISLEECAKIEMLGAQAAAHLTGQAVDQKKFIRAFIDHGAKNRTNAYMLEANEEEKVARESGDFAAARDAFKKQQREFHDTSNTAKNSALYVDYRDGKATSPREKISKEMADAAENRNRTYLGLMQPKVALVRKWANDPAEAQTHIHKFDEVMRRMMKQYPDHPDQALKSMLSHMQEWISGKRK